MREHAERGGIAGTYARFVENQRIISEGFNALGCKTFVNPAVQSPVITAFLYPTVRRPAWPTLVRG